MNMLLRLLKTGIIFALVLFTVSAIAIAGLYLYLSPQLPSIEGLSDVRLQVPLRIYSSDGSLMGEFGEKRRSPKSLDDIPDRLKQAFLSAEDDRFFEHPGVDYQGILRAIINLITTGERGQGGSTITMQLARNFYLSREKTYTRKLSEIFLALKIERELSKEKILELYLNKIYLGNRSYGVAAAAQIYYGATLDELTLPQIAMIAGLPKAPSRYNPIINPERATSRRNYVLARMRDLDYITKEEFKSAREEAVTAALHKGRVQINAPYINEMVRVQIVSQFGDEAYTRGLRVYTTVDDVMQEAANNSLWNGLVAYDRRHGYRGVIRHVQVYEDEPADELHLHIEDDRNYGKFKPAIVTSIETVTVPVPATTEGEKQANDKNTAEQRTTTEQQVNVVLKDGEQAVIKLAGLKWARPYISVNRIGEAPKTPDKILQPGDVIWVVQNASGEWELGQVPEIQGALVALSSNDGAIKALTGGFNFRHSKFNRAVQAKRQAGSGFKPYIYASALEKSFTPATLVNDAPVVFEDDALEASWRPENYSGKFFGPTRFRKALYKSRNLVSIRVLKSVGIRHAIRYLANFGFDENELPRDLSLALGSADVSPLQQARGYAVFANGGYLIDPYVIQRIEDADGTVLYEADPVVACVPCVLSERRWQQSPAADVEDALEKLPKQAEQTLEPRLVYLINSILQDVIRKGTGVRARSLGRNDIAGKTGTTNDQRDAWFNGYNPDLVAITWVGFDQLKPLGNKEAGSSAALPLWIEFMKTALAGKPQKQLKRPKGLVTVKINAKTGAPATEQDVDTLFEMFRSENAPVARAVATEGPLDPDETETPIPEQLF
ncbi:MAG: penicillin-binding protein 1A [Gammaproteobacteria bacterium]|nr:penicillin-binding protein 1A [Gammaproteobacteria bacterium]